MAKDGQNGFQTRIPWAIRTAWPLLAKAYGWYLANGQNIQHKADLPAMFIPVEIFECESDKDDVEGDGKCCYNLYLGFRLSMAFWTHSIRIDNRSRGWVIDRIVIEDDGETVGEWEGTEGIAKLA